jgi:hypothetical protein
MAKVGFDTGGIDALRGRTNGKNKRTGYYYKEMYGETILVQADWKLQEPTETQMARRARFATAATQASADMANPTKKAEWQAVADASNGRYKTARGAAFSSYYADAE